MFYKHFVKIYVHVQNYAVEKELKKNTKPQIAIEIESPPL